MAKKDFSTMNTAPVYETITAATTEAPKEPDRRPGRKPTENTERLSLAVKPELAEYVRTMARITGRTINDFIILALEQNRESNAALYTEAQKFIKSLEK